MDEAADNMAVNKFTFKKFLRCVAIALKWLCIILLIEIFIVGAVLGVSWKIFILFLGLIVLALIPKRIRKYNYIPVIVLVTICNIWILVPDKDHTWVPFTFDAELAELESKRIIAGQENAAAVYLGLVDKYRDTVFRPNINDFQAYSLDCYKAFSTESYPELSQMITDQQAVITALVEAVEYDKCYFAIPHDMSSVKEQQLRLFTIKCLSRLLLYSASNDIGDNRFDLAVTKQLAVLKTADHLYQQRTLFDNSAAAYIELTALKNINIFVMRHCSDPAVIESLSAHLKMTDEYFPENWDSIYDSLNILVKNMVAMLYEVHPDGRIRRSHTIAPTVNRQFRAGMRISPFQMTIVKAGAVGHWFVLPSTPQAAADMIDTAFDYYSPTSSTDMSMPPRPKLRMNYKYVTQRSGHYCGKWYYSIETQSKTRQSAHRATAIICAIKKYYLENDRYPESLDALTGIDPLVLIDAVNCGAFVYKKTGDDFLLYSTGRNKIDDGGVKVPTLGYDDVRHWPPEPPGLPKQQ